MEITEVRIKLMEESEDRLRAFCSITLDHCFVIRDLKIIDGSNGPFVAMPSRKLTGRCHQCGFKNHLRSNYCNQCGSRLSSSDIRDAESIPNKLYADIAHPINQECRDQIQKAVVAEYEAELFRAQEPGYVSRYDDDYSDSSTANDVSTRSNPPTSPSEPNRPASGNVPAPHFDKQPKRQDSNTRDDDEFGKGIIKK